MSNYENKNGKNKPTRKPLTVGEGYDAPFRGYINVTLTPEDKDHYGEWAASGSYWDVFEASVQDGIVLSIKRDKRGEGYLTSATQRREASPNAGLVVTARAKEATLSFGRTLFILALLSHHERWEETSPMSDPDRW